MDDLESIHFKNENAVLAALHPLHGVVVDAQVADAHVLERLFNGIPLTTWRASPGRWSLRPDTFDDLGLLTIIDCLDASVVGVLMADQDHVRIDLRLAVFLK